MSRPPHTHTYNDDPFPLHIVEDDEHLPVGPAAREILQWDYEGIVTPPGEARILHHCTCGFARISRVKDDLDEEDLETITDLNFVEYHRFIDMLGRRR